MFYLAISIIGCVFFSTLLFGVSFLSRVRRDGVQALLLGGYFLGWSVYVSTNFLVLPSLFDAPTIGMFSYQSLWFLGPILYLYHLNALGRLSTRAVAGGLMVALALGVGSVVLEWNHENKFSIDAFKYYLYYTLASTVQFLFAWYCAKGLKSIDFGNSKIVLTESWHRILYVGLMVLLSLRVINYSLGFFINDYDLYLPYYNVFAFLVLSYIALVIVKSFNHSSLLNVNSLPSLLNAQSQDQASHSTYEAILKAVEEKMESEQVFTDPGLTLGKLAGLLEMKSYLISKSINVVRQQTFVDFLNTYRINYALDLLAHSKTHRTVQEVMYASGFNSRSSFHTAFRKQTGTTPLDYKRSLGTGLGQPVASSI